MNIVEDGQIYAWGEDGERADGVMVIVVVEVDAIVPS